MLKIVKKLLRISTDKPMERWSERRLADAKQYLEDKPATEWTHEDHYLAVEHTIQRYLPADEFITEAQYRAKLEKLNRQIDWNIANPDAPREEPVHDPEFQKWMEDKFQERFGHSMKR